MARSVVTLGVVGLMWLGYAAWPLSEFYVLVNALETRDVETMVRHVYFDSVRRSLADQIVTAYVQRTGAQLSPRLQGVAASALVIADPVLSKLYRLRHFLSSSI